MIDLSRGFPKFSGERKFCSPTCGCLDIKKTEENMARFDYRKIGEIGNKLLAFQEGLVAAGNIFAADAAKGGFTEPDLLAAFNAAVTAKLYSLRCELQALEENVPERGNLFAPS